MDKARELLIELTRRGIALFVSDGQIRFTGPQGALTPDLRSGLASHKPEVLSMYSGFQIHDSLNRIADVWDADIESRGEGDDAWAWIKASDHWQAITAAEDVVNRIGSRGKPEELNAACSEWLAAWVEAIAAWQETCRHMDKAKIVDPGAAQSKNGA